MKLEVMNTIRIRGIFGILKVILLLHIRKTRIITIGRLLLIRDHEMGGSIKVIIVYMIMN